ncbi:MAG: DUF3160 domain-containing protein [Deltaproteobacteria bacterium]|nr:DUF3160 domain-containing protein [Deltaproteobacteria bacterium]
MKRFKIAQPVSVAIIVAIIVALISSVVIASETKQANSELRFLKPIKSPKAWYADQVAHGSDIYFSANYIFQATKLRTQEIQVDYEQASVYPMLRQLLDEIKQMGIKGPSLVFVEMARKLLDPQAKTDPAVSKEVVSRLEAFKNDPQNLPRGRYSSSEDLKRYFQGVQFLTKATFDVKVDKRWFAQRDYMLFPFEAGAEVLTLMATPENKQTLEKLNRVSDFYDRLVGPSDLPSFHGLIKADVALTIDDVLRYAEDNSLPKINKQMGVGVQFLGERFALHQSVINSLTETFLADDPKVNRKKVMDVLEIKNVFLGKKGQKKEVTGLNETQFKSNDLSTPSFYESSLRAILDLPVISPSNDSINTGAACLTALAEQTILVTKQTTLVPKSAAPEPDQDKKPVNIYVEPNIENFLKRLSSADKTISSICEQEPQIILYDTLIKASKEQTPIASNTPDGATLTRRLANLPSDPTVTADVFFLNSRNDKGFVQWAIGPFEVERSFKDGAKAIGMEMVFFEGWNDTGIKKARTPMTNEQWKKLFLKGDYKNFKSMIKAP